MKMSQSSIINHQSSIINHQSSIINHQSSIINHQSEKSRFWFKLSELSGKFPPLWLIFSIFLDLIKAEFEKKSSSLFNPLTKRRRREDPCLSK
jgi:hypothetical protein